MLSFSANQAENDPATRGKARSQTSECPDDTGRSDQGGVKRSPCPSLVRPILGHTLMANLRIIFHPFSVPFRVIPLAAGGFILRSAFVDLGVSNRTVFG